MRNVNHFYPVENTVFTLLIKKTQSNDTVSALRLFSVMCLKYLVNRGPKNPGATSAISKTTGKKQQM